MKSTLAEPALRLRPALPRLLRRRPRVSRSFPLALLLCVRLLPAPPGLAAQTPEPRGGTPAPPPSRQAPPGHRDVREIRVFQHDGGRVAWSTQGSWIAFDRADPEGRYDLWVIRADGTGERCLTCDVYELRKESSFNPTWDPSGQYVVFQVQSLSKRLGMTPVELATPLRGAHCELWMVRLEGRGAWQLTRIGERGGLVADPHFSHEGGQILWSERVRGGGAPWGDWAVRVAKLEIGRGVPHLGKVKTYRPGKQPGLVLAQGFTPNDRGFLYSDGNGGLFRFELESRAEGGGVPVGPGEGARGELARLLPGRDGLLWASSLGLPRRDRWQKLPRRDDLWIESPRDARAGRLTFFNEPASDHFLGEALVDDVAWSPEGDRFVAHVVHAGREGVREDIYLVILDPAYRR